jgi:hypothetical protein
MQARTSGAISSSVSGLSTTKGYSTRQSVASVTCDTRLKPSNWMLSRRVRGSSFLSTWRRRRAVCSKSASKVSTAEVERSSSSLTATLSWRRASMARRRWRSASTSALRRLMLASRSSCR